jgi:hypothetical protein
MTDTITFQNIDPSSCITLYNSAFGLVHREVNAIILVKHETMKTDGEVETQFHTF